MAKRRKNRGRTLRWRTGHWRLVTESAPVVHLIRTVVVLLCLLSVRASRSPANLVAQEAAPAPTEILQRAQQALQNKNWTDAADAFAQALDLSAESMHEPIKDRLQWCRAQIAVDKSYSDGSLAQLIRTTDVFRAQAHLAETLRLIEQEYHRSLDRGQWFNRALLQLRAALNNESVLSQFDLDRNYLEQVRRQIQSAPADTEQWPDHTNARILRFAVSLRDLSDKAGLGPSWPALALSYACADNVDKYSYIFSPNQYDTMRDQLNGNYVGLGIELTMAGDYPCVFDVIDASPAAIAGIAPGDLLLTADAESLKDKSEPQVTRLLAGPRGSSLRLTAQRGGRELTLVVLRDLLTAPTVRHCRLIGSDKPIGYVRVSGFDYDTAMEMCRALDRLDRQGAQSYLIDLRTNGGGLMTAAIDAVRLFIDHGLIATVKTERQNTRYEAGGNAFRSYQKPLAILVDENTASAAEIFTAALQEHHRATVIGQKTFGKALVQTVYDLNHAQTALCITTASYTPPSDVSFLNIGITPDIIIENKTNSAENNLSISDYLSEKNPALRRGIAVLTQTNND